MIRRNANKAVTYDPSVFVTTLYEQLLGRAPSQEEAAGHLTALLKGKADAAAMVARFVCSEEYTQRRAATQANFINANDQFGEIALLLRELAERSVSQQVVVDVGTRGRERSNSWDLMQHFGWRGLLVEANPALLPNILSEFSGLNCNLVSAAVSDYNGSAELTIGSNDDVSSLDPAAAASWGKTRGTVTVNVRRLPEILAENGIPLEFGLLSLDIEGEDVKVLVDLIAGSDYRPDYIIIEASQDFQITALEMLDVPTLVRDSYEIFAQTRANLLLRRIEAQSQNRRSLLAGPASTMPPEPFVESSDLIMAKGVSGGHWVTHRSDLIIGGAIRQTGQFQEQAIDDVIKILDSCGHTVSRSCFVDIGANIGSHSIHAARLGFGKVIAFEPDPQNFRLLSANLVLHGVEEVVACHQIAISHQDGAMKMECSPSNFGDHRLRVSNDIAQNVHDEEQWALQDVKVRTFDSLVLEGILPKDGPDLLWIDTQGHEGHVLASAHSLRTMRCPVVLEFWPYGLERSGGYSMLREALMAREDVRIVDLNASKGDSLNFLKLDSLDQMYEDLRKGESKQGSPHTDLLLIPIR